uniref:Uncharacterized protein n=1 Tax=Rhizophora mucronata TaxID=61149 RepID=A0A2P2PWR1_RHIMU
MHDTNKFNNCVGNVWVCTCEGERERCIGPRYTSKSPAQ